MQNLPWHEAGLSPVEALAKWCADLLAEKQEAVDTLAKAKAVKTEADNAKEVVTSHKTALESQAQMHAQTKSRLDQRELDLNARAVELQAKERDLVSRETALKLKQDTHAANVEDAAVALSDREQVLVQREAKLAAEQKQLADDKAAHEKRVKRVREAVG